MIGFLKFLLEDHERKRLEEIAEKIGKSTAARAMAEMQLKEIQQRKEDETGIRAKKRLEMVEQKKIKEIAKLTHQINQMVEEQRQLWKKVNNLRNSQLER